MTPEIKQRIEQIRNGEVPEGYKRTRAGIMPCDWCTQKEYKAKDIFYSVSNKNHNGDYEVLSATQDRGVIPRSQVDIDIKYDDANTSGYKMVDKGDFVISLRSFQGGIEYSEYTGLVSPAYTVLKPRVSICDEYYKSYFKTNDFISRLNKGTYGIRDGKQVGFKDFGEMIIHFPPLPEQQRIAKILSTQDKVIECYENKIEQLKRMKKYYLQNMFPKRGETVPKIRFKGFTDPWEQRKLDNLAQFTKGTGYSKGELKESGTPIILYGRLYTKYETVITSIDTFTDAKPDSVYSRGGEVIVPASGETAEDISIASVVEKSGVLLGGDLNIITPSTTIDSAFLAISISNGTPHNNIAKMAQGKSVVHLHNTDLKKIDLSYPCYEEQRQISDFFKRYDNRITLHQRKLEEEKKKKKALQQLLLTGIVRTN